MSVPIFWLIYGLMKKWNEEGDMMEEVMTADTLIEVGKDMFVSMLEQEMGKEILISVLDQVEPDQLNEYLKNNASYHQMLVRLETKALAKGQAKAMY